MKDKFLDSKERLMLERYFKQKLAESFLFREIGSWWKPKNEQFEIDIVALTLEKNKVFVAEVKRHKKNYKPALFAAKLENLEHKVLAKYNLLSFVLNTKR